MQCTLYRFIIKIKTKNPTNSTHNKIYTQNKVKNSEWRKTIECELLCVQKFINTHPSSDFHSAERLKIEILMDMVFVGRWNIQSHEMSWDIKKWWWEGCHGLWMYVYSNYTYTKHELFMSIKIFLFGICVRALTN